MSLDFSNVKSWNIPEGEVLSASLNGVTVWEKQSPAPTPSITADVTFIDYDGTILYEYTAADFLNLSALPATVDHTSMNDGLGAGAWNVPIDIVKNQVRNCGKAIVGQTCEVLNDIDDSMHRLFTIYLENVKSMNLNYAVNTFSTSTPTYNYKYWGDGTSTNNGYTINSSGKATINTQHTYDTVGDYTLAINGSYTNLAYNQFLMTYRNYYNLISGTDTDGSNLKEKIKKMYVGDRSDFPDYLTEANNCEYVNLECPAGKNYSNNYYKNIGLRWYKLKAIVFPCMIVDPSSSASFSSICSYTTDLKVASIPPYMGFDQGNVRMFNYSGIEQIYLPYYSRKFYNCFNNCTNLKEVILPNYNNSPNYNVEISDCFKDCTALESIKFTNTVGAKYTISDNSFQNLPTTCKIYVPSSLMTEYKALSGMPDPTVYEYIGY